MRKQQGLSLVELMISLTLGLVLMTGVVQMFLTSRVTYSTQQAISKIQESGRMGVEFLARDIRMAGYTGCSSRNPLINFQNGLDPASITAGSIYDFGDEDDPNIISQTQIGITGFEAGDDFPHADMADDVKAGTDVLAVRRASSNGMSLLSPVDSSANVVVSGPEQDGCVGDVCLDDIVVMTDCTHGRLFKITNLQGIGSGSDVRLVHSSQANENPKNKNPNNWGQEFDLGAEVMKMSNITYYVAESSFNPNTFSLWQVEDDESPTELIEGVEDMSLRYGVDTNGDEIPDTYRTADQIEAGDDWPNVAAVRVQLLLQSAEDNVLPDAQPMVFDGANVDTSDRRMRQIFTSTVGVRGRLN